MKPTLNKLSGDVMRKLCATKHLEATICLMLFFIGISITAHSYRREGTRLTKEQIEKMEKIEVYPKGETPKRKYKFVSPVSEKARNEQQIFQRMRHYATKIGADAIIDFECLVTNQQEASFGLVRSTAYCRGKAVKWE